MKRFRRLTIVPLLLCAAHTTLPAQQSASPAPDIEPAVMQALNRMGAYIRALKSYHVKAEITTEEVLDDGQKLQFARNVNIVARMPDRLLAEIDGDILKRLYVYDGKTFTGAALRAGYYATVAAPPTIGELIDFVNKFDIELPLVDLFLWGGPRSDTKAIRSAVDVGPGNVAGITCQHYALRQPGLDWQVWIQLGDHPLPRKLVLTTTDDEARPQFSAIINWNLAPSYGEGTFTFVPPPGVVKAVFSGDKTAVGKKK